METKTFEVRDDATFIPVLAVRLEPGCEEDRYLLARTSYGSRPEAQARFVIVMRLDSNEANYQPGPWVGGRTMNTAHKHIQEHFADLPSGAVIDVAHILGETPKPKLSERLEDLVELVQPDAAPF